MATPTATAVPNAGPVESSTTTPSPSATALPALGGSSDDPNHNNKMSNLYLVTFLATLFILLLISGAIVMRSYFLRRRYQRRLEEALASGLVLAPHAQGGKRKRFGAKPGLFEVCVRESIHPTNRKSESENAKYGPPNVGQKYTLLKKDPLGVVGGAGRVVDSLQWGSWGTILPLSAQPIFVRRKYRGIAEPSSSPGRLVNFNPIVDPTSLLHPGPPSTDPSILATRPPPSRFLNLFGIDSEAYSVAYLSAQHANRGRRTQDAQRRVAGVQADTAARVRRLERTLYDMWGISGSGRSRRAAAANANAAPMAGHSAAPTVLAPALAPEQRANHESEAARMHEYQDTVGVEWNAPPPAWQTPVPAPVQVGEGAGTVVVQMADGTRVMGVPVPVPVLEEDSDSEDEGGADAPVEGRVVQEQSPRNSQPTEQGVVLDAEFGVNTTAGSTAPATVPATARTGNVLTSTTSLPSSATAPLPEAAVHQRSGVLPPTSLTSATTAEATQPAVVSSLPIPPAPAVKIRVEMLQIAVLIAMPTPPRKCRSGRPSSTSKTAPATTTATAVHPATLRASLDEDLDEVSVKSASTDGEYVDFEASINGEDSPNKGKAADDEDEWDGDRPLPEVVLGVARVQYQHPPDLNVDPKSPGGVGVDARADEENDALGRTVSGTRGVLTSRTSARRQATTRGSSFGGSAAFGIPG